MDMTEEPRSSRALRDAGMEPFVDGLVNKFELGPVMTGCGKPLTEVVDELVADAVVRPVDIVARLLIVPHAGYVYSGPVAAAA